MHFTPQQNLPHRAIILVFILRYAHCPCRTISFHIIVNKNLLHVFTKPPTQNIHTFSPRTSTKIPTSRLLHDHPLPPATITFARTPPDLWTTIPQFLIFKIKVCKHSIKITPRNSSTRTSRTPTPPQVPIMTSTPLHFSPLFPTINGNLTLLHCGIYSPTYGAATLPKFTITPFYITSQCHIVVLSNDICNSRSTVRRSLCLYHLVMLSHALSPV